MAKLATSRAEEPKPWRTSARLTDSKLRKMFSYSHIFYFLNGGLELGGLITGYGFFSFIFFVLNTALEASHGVHNAIMKLQDISTLGK